MTDPAPVQIDLQNVVRRLGGQLGQAFVDLAAAYEMIDAQGQVIADLQAKLADAQPPTETPSTT